MLCQYQVLVNYLQDHFKSSGSESLYAIKVTVLLVIGTVYPRSKCGSSSGQEDVFMSSKHLSIDLDRITEIKFGSSELFSSTHVKQDIVNAIKFGHLLMKHIQRHLVVLDGGHF